MSDFSWANVPGFFDFQDIYDKAVKDAPSDRPSLFIEVGVFFGRSLFYLSDAATKSGKPITIEAVDPFFKGWTRGQLRQLWDDALKTSASFPNLRCSEPVLTPGWFDGDLNEVLNMGGLSGVMAAAEQLGLDRHINFWACKGQKVFPSKVDFVFLDAQHTYEDTLELLLHYLPRVTVGRVVAGHDFVGSQYPGVKRAVEQVFGADYEVVGNSFVHTVKGPLTQCR